MKGVRFLPQLSSLILLAACSNTTPTPAPTPSPTPTPSVETVKIQLKQTGLYLDNRGCNGSTVGLFGYSQQGEACQVWKLIPEAGGYYRIQVLSSDGNGKTPKYLDNSGCDNTNIGLSVYSTAQNGACQLWKIVPQDNDFYRLLLKSSEGKTLLYLDNRFCDKKTVGLAGYSDASAGSCQLWKSETYSAP